MAEFTKREMDILLILLAERDWITGEEIAGRLGISKKTVQQEIRMIEETLGLEAGLCSGQKKGYRLNGVSQEQLQRILMCLEENEAHYNMKDRTSVLALYLLFQRDYVTMDRLAEIFYLSKTTVFSEIKTLKRWMGRQGGITLEVSGTKGVLIRGKEMDRRFRCATFCMTGILKQILLDERELQQYEQELAAIRTELGTELAEADIRICGEDFGKICRYLAVSLLRNRLGFQGEDDEELEKKNIQTRMLFAGNLTRHPCFDEMRRTKEGYRVAGSLENTDRIMNDTFWIGVYPGMTEEMLAFMAKTLKEAVGK